MCMDARKFFFSLSDIKVSLPFHSLRYMSNGQFVCISGLRPALQGAPVLSGKSLVLALEARPATHSSPRAHHIPGLLMRVLHVCYLLLCTQQRCFQAVPSYVCTVGNIFLVLLSHMWLMSHFSFQSRLRLCSLLSSGRSLLVLSPLTLRRLLDRAA